MGTAARDSASTARRTARTGRGRGGEAVSASMIAAGRLSRPLLLLAKIILPIALVAAIACAVVYVRLLNGPISLKFLAGPIARSIAVELPDTVVAIDDAVVSFTSDGSVEFRLRNVRLSDRDGAPIAIAPQAAFSVSHDALWSGRIAPSRIVLIEPRMLVFYSPERGLALSFSRPGEPEAAQPDRTAALPAQPTQQLQPLDLSRLVANANAKARKRADATSYLTDIGIRNATVIFDNAGQQTLWRIIEADLDLEHKKRRSTIDGSMSVASSAGPWQLAFRIEESEKEQSIVVSTTLRDMVPRAIADIAPQLSGLAAIQAPVSAQARLTIGGDGQLQEMSGRLQLAQGPVVMPGAPETSIAVENGIFDLSYDRLSGRVELTDGVLIWGGGRVALRGSARRVGPPDGRANWAIELRSTDGVLSAPDLGDARVRLDEASLTALVDTETGRMRQTQLLMRAAGTQISVSGAGSLDDDGRSLQIDGQISPMALPTLKAIWPKWLAPRARQWVGKHVTKGQLQATSFKMIGSPRAFKTATAGKDQRLTLSMEASNLQVVPVSGMAPVDAPRALLRVEGSNLEIAIPDAAIATAPNRRIALKGGRLAATEIMGERPAADLTFRAQGNVAAALDFVTQEPIAIPRSLLPFSEGVEGKVDGSIKLQFPLIEDVPSSEMKTEAKVTMTDLKARQFIGTRDLQGGRIILDVSENALEAKGDLLIAGVNTRLAWQRIFGGAEDQQPPLRLTASLDNSDRTQLGLDINHIIQGELPIEVLVSRDQRNEPQVRVRADLTNADMTLQTLAWRKPPGRSASMQFDVAKGTKHKTELQNFKLVGDDIAIDGWLALDAQNKLREFLFPDFSINVVSRLEMQGTLRQDNVWDMRVRGSTYDGRDYFKSLFAVGQSTEQAAGSKDQAGIDLRAEIDNVLGQSESTLKGVRVQLSRRQGKLSQLTARGTLEGGRTLEVNMKPAGNGPRMLEARSDDAGRLFKLVGFYPNMQNGRMKLDVNLDGRGPVEKNGILYVEAFQVLGDPIVSEVLQISGESGQPEQTDRRGAKPKFVRQVFEFDWMRAPFSVGNQQFVIDDSEIRGPLVGAVIRGKADFRARQVSIGGTYVPLQGLNSAIGAIPGLGQLLAGPRGEGVLGITFAIQGPMAQPQVIVNPLSLIAPGIFREMFQMTNPTPGITPAQPRDTRPKAATPAATKSSSTPIVAPPGAASGPASAPQIQDGWTSGTSTTPKKK